MDRLYVFSKEKRDQKDRRKSNLGNGLPDKRVDDRRTFTGINIEYINTLLEQMRGDLIKSLEYYKDKERKKLLLISSSFGVVAVMISILLGASEAVSFVLPAVDSGNGEPTTKAAESVAGILPMVAVIGIALINLVITKYVISLKSESFMSIRQVNCLRQGIHSLLYFKLHSKLPCDNSELTKGAFGALYGKHKKFDIDNESIRDRYRSNTIYYKSADLLAVAVLGILSLSIAAYPVLQAIPQGIQFDKIHYLSMFVTVVFAIVLFFETINSTKKIRGSLNLDKQEEVVGRQFELVSVP